MIKLGKYFAGFILAGHDLPRNSFLSYHLLPSVDLGQNTYKFMNTILPENVPLCQWMRVEIEERGVRRM